MQFSLHLRRYSLYRLALRLHTALSVVGLQNQSLAASYAFTLREMEWISSTALGFFFLCREGLSLKTIREQAEHRDILSC